MKKALMILADGFEEIEAFSPVDILRRADIEVTIAGLSGKAIESARGVKVTADIGLTEAEGEFDAVVFPGGAAGAENLAKSEKVKSIIKSMHAKGKIIAAICASPAWVLAPTGILKDKNATGYPGTEKEFPKDVKFKSELVVADGNIITSKGPGTAALFGLKLVEILAGKEKAEDLKKKMLIT